MNRKNLTELVARWRKAADDLAVDVEEFDNAEEEERDALSAVYSEVADELEAELNNKGKSFYDIHFDGTGFRTLATYRLFFKAALQRVLDGHRAYEEAVDEWYFSGPGAEGYQYPECIHGSSLTTDYDNICGGCEDPSTPIQIAIVSARTDFLRFNKAWEWANDCPNDLPYELRSDLILRAWKLFPQVKEA